MGQVKRCGRDGRSGLTLVELVLALGLFALLSVGVVQLIDGSLGVIDKAGTERELMLSEGAALRWLEADFAALAGGDAADLVVGWHLADVDGDGVAGRALPLVRLVRRAAPRDLERLGGLIESEDEDNPDLEARRLRTAVGRAPLVEVLYGLQPSLSGPAREAAPGRRGDLRLVRAERLEGGPGRSFFDVPLAQAGALIEDALLAGTGDVVAERVLRFEVQFAAETTALDRGWSPGTALGQSLVVWEARGLGRVDPELAARNAPSAALPATPGPPVLPRRVRIELVLEPERVHRRRPRLLDGAALDAERLRFERADRLPGPGTRVLLGEEWVEIAGVPDDEGTVAVVRGLDGTRPTPLRYRTPAQWGTPAVREVGLAAAREEWRE